MNQISRFVGSNREIEQIAEKLRERVLNGGEMNNSVLLRTIVERTGGTITVASDPSAQEVEGGSLVIRGERDFTIFLSPYTSPLRDNFTIGHELGHYALHFLPRKTTIQLPLSFTRYGTGPAEWQANRFAAALLMPAQQFQARFHQSNGNTFLLSGEFAVSRSAVEVRATSLGLLDG